MGTNKLKRIIYINEIAFFLGWVVVFLLGADKPPPIGFMWLVLLTAFLDVVQYFYLKKFLPDLNDKSKGLFIKNLLFSILAGIGVNILTILPNLKIFLSIGFIDSLIWILVIIIVAVLYGIWFYIVNVILIKFIKC